MDAKLGRPHPFWMPGMVVVTLLVLVLGHDGREGGGERETYKIEAGWCVKLLRRRTTRHATIYGESGRVVSRKGEAGESETHCAGHGCGGIEEDAHDGVQVEEHEYGREEVGDETSGWQENGVSTSVNMECSIQGAKENARNDEIDEPILKDHVREPAAAHRAHERPQHGLLTALLARDPDAGEGAELVGIEEEDDEVERHAVDEGGGEEGVVGGGEDAADPWDPFGAHEDACGGVVGGCGAKEKGGD
jgi:hypothetical protein